jgi:hypothetical protein
MDLEGSMERLEAISVNLTTEEMVVLLDQLDAESYAGLDTSELDELSARERNLVLDVARRGLMARQILTRDEAGDWQVGQFALAALGVSLSPTRSVMIIRGQSRDSSDSFLFHTAQDVFITHEVIENATHQFLILRDGETWRESILSAAGLDRDVSQDEIPEAPPALIHQSLLNEVYEQAQSGFPDKAEAMLTEQGVDNATSRNLAATLAGSVTFATIIAITHTPEARQNDMTLLTGANGCWLLEVKNGQGDDSQFSVTPLPTEHARQQLIDLIA